MKIDGEDLLIMKESNLLGVVAYLSPYFITNAEKMVAELDDPYILIHEKKLSSLQAMLPVLEAVVQTGKLLDAFTPSDCASYFTAAGYDLV